jgi:hypothetical protein
VKNIENARNTKMKSDRFNKNLSGSPIQKTNINKQKLVPDDKVEFLFEDNKRLSVEFNLLQKQYSKMEANVNRYAQYAIETENQKIKMENDLNKVIFNLKRQMIILEKDNKTLLE